MITVSIICLFGVICLVLGYWRGYRAGNIDATLRADDIFKDYIKNEERRYHQVKGVVTDGK